MIAAITLPLLLAGTLAVVGLLARHGVGVAAGTDPVRLVPGPAADAASPACARLLDGLPAELSGPDGPLPRRPVAEPAPPGAVAWAASPRSVVLRCGLGRPAELTQTSALLQVNGVRWLTLSEADVDTFVAVDRPVYVALTVSRGLGSGPVQAVSDAIRGTLPSCELSQVKDPARVGCPAG